VVFHTIVNGAVCACVGSVNGCNRFYKWCWSSSFVITSSVINDGDTSDLLWTQHAYNAISTEHISGFFTPSQLRPQTFAVVDSRYRESHQTNNSFALIDQRFSTLYW